MHQAHAVQTSSVVLQGTTVVTMLEQQSSLALILPGFETRHQRRQNVALLLSASPSSTAVAFEVYINPLSDHNT